MNHKEIERKWMVNGWPEGLCLQAEYEMEQGYLCVKPTVRIRRESKVGGKTEYILCFKGKGRLARQELEKAVEPEFYEGLKEIIAKPLIPKTRRDYALPDGLRLEVNQVDQGQPTEFMYAEVEFATEAEALSWQPPQALAGYLSNEVTNQPGQSMGAYWQATREK